MQNVEGSNPFGRFASNPLHLGHSAHAGESKPLAWRSTEALAPAL